VIIESVECGGFGLSVKLKKAPTKKYEGPYYSNILGCWRRFATKMMMYSLESVR